jgi:hypothetical protein
MMTLDVHAPGRFGAAVVAGDDAIVTEASDARGS